MTQQVDGDAHAQRGPSHVRSVDISMRRSTFGDRRETGLSQASAGLHTHPARGESMPIPTELVGSLPRPERLQNAYQDYDDGKIDWPALQAEQDAAAEDSIKRLEATGEPIVTDGEQRESSFATYSLTNTLAGTGLADRSRLGTSSRP